MTRLSSLAALGLLTLPAGCGYNVSSTPPAKAYPVTGKVVGPGGQPVTYGTVTFIPQDRSKGFERSVNINPDGTYKLSTFAIGDGGVPGEYVVTVTPDVNGQVKQPDRVPKKYRSADQSSLKVEVKAQDNAIDLVLKN